jgi:hypothetical protein
LWVPFRPWGQAPRVWSPYRHLVFRENVHVC